MPDAARPVHVPRGRAPHGRRRVPVTFRLEERLVTCARAEVGEPELVRCLEAALVAAVDYRRWMREVAAGRQGAGD